MPAQEKYWRTSTLTQQPARMEPTGIYSMHRASPAGQQTGIKTTVFTKVATELVMAVERAARANGQEADTKARLPQDAGQAIQMNLLLELQLTGLVSKVTKLAGYSMYQLRAAVASSPCETFSLADASNISRGHYYRDHQDHTKPPRWTASCKTAEQAFTWQMAIEHDNLVRYLMVSYEADIEAGHHYVFLIENPVGSLRHL